MSLQNDRPGFNMKTERVPTMNTEINHAGLCITAWEPNDTYAIEEKRYLNQHLYAVTVETIKTTQIKVSLLSIDEIWKDQEKYQECKKTESLAQSGANEVTRR